MLKNLTINNHIEILKTLKLGSLEIIGLAEKDKGMDYYIEMVKKRQRGFKIKANTILTREEVKRVSKEAPDAQLELMIQRNVGEEGLY